MDCVSPILDVVTRVWDCTAKHAVYIWDLQENMDSLRNAMQELKNLYQDVKERVDLEEQRQMRRTNDVDGWLHSILAMEQEVNEVLQEGHREVQNKCPGTCCPRNCLSSYKLGKKASKKLGAVTELRKKGRFDVVAERLLEKTVGLDLKYEEVCTCIQDEQLGIIGLYGIGGAGKTTLMTKVNNEFIRASREFEIAIWVVVSRSASVGKVQEVIRKNLKIVDTWRNRTEDEKAVEIFNLLKAKRFVMLLDDVWEPLDLQQVGVPSPNSQNKSKVILTTRSLAVCRDMAAQICIMVECLTEEEAINLFKEKVGETTLNSHPDIPRFAEIAAKECKGLPLALVTFGRAMAGKNTPQEWKQAIQKLTHPSKFSGMGDHVFRVLKFSYDNLPNDTIKACFLYLAIFPVDYEITENDLIFLWIGEGHLDECDNIDEAFNQGQDMIEHLKTVRLFESGRGYDSVKMHDVIRDMALWLATASSGNKKKILVEENDYVEAHQVLKWKEAQRIFLWIGDLKELTVPLYFPNLLTLIVKSRGLGTFPSGFFHFMPIIKVLDLSLTKIAELPTGIGKLVTLEYLNLSGTYLRKLPAELKTLKRIRYLLLGSMPFLKIISKEVISNLSMMRFFLVGFNYLSVEQKASHSLKEEEEPNYSREDYKAPYLWKNNNALVEELEGLEHINWVSSPIVGALSFQKLLSSQKLQNVMRGLGLVNLEGMTLLQLPRMKHLLALEICRCRELQEITEDLEKEGRWGFVADYIPKSNFYSLREVRIYQLPKLLDLTWLVYIPSLEDLYVYDCESMEQVIIGDASEVPENLGIFFRLKYLNLLNLPNLRSICRRALLFPYLKHLSVSECPNLRELPLDLNSARNSSMQIIGEPCWWGGLQWENETIRLTFTPYFKPRDYL